MPTIEIKRLKEGFFSDPVTGWAAYPFQYGFGESGADIRAVHVVAIMPGQVRGNHYHEKTNEMLFFFAGKGAFYWEEEGRVHEHPVDGHPILIIIPPGIKHAFRNTGETTVFLLAVRDGKFDPDAQDIVRSVIAGV